MQINTTLRFHLTTVRIVTIKSNTIGEDVWKSNPHTLLVGCKLVQPLWKTIWRLLKKLLINLPYDPTIPLLGIYLKESYSGHYKVTCTPMFIAALFT
jgi:hypothetical protein